MSVVALLVKLRPHVCSQMQRRLGTGEQDFLAVFPVQHSQNREFLTQRGSDAGLKETKTKHKSTLQQVSMTHQVYDTECSQLLLNSKYGNSAHHTVFKLHG